MKIPNIANGTVLPNSFYELEMKELKEKQLRKQQFRHDWSIAIFGLFGGGIMGVITSLAVLKLQGLL